MLQVGDFIAIANLAAKACQALSSSKGSKAQFTSLLTTLKAVGQAMIHAEAVCMEYHTFPLSETCQEKSRRDRLDEIAEEIVKQRNECDELLSDFLFRFKSYEIAFIKQDPGLIKQGYKSLVFQFRKDEVATFEKELHDRLQAMQLLLNSFF